MISSILIKTKRKEGFTLIELLVVIAIIGTLSTIGFIALSSSQQGANDAVRVSELQTLRSAINIAYLNTPNVPTTATAGTCEWANGAQLASDMAGKVEGIDWDKVFYCTNTAHTQYVIGTVLSQNHQVLTGDTDGNAGNLITAVFDVDKDGTNEAATAVCDDAKFVFCMKGAVSGVK